MLFGVAEIASRKCELLSRKLWSIQLTGAAVRSVRLLVCLLASSRLPSSCFLTGAAGRSNVDTPSLSQVSANFCCGQAPSGVTNSASAPFGSTFLMPRGFVALHVIAQTGLRRGELMLSLLLSWEGNRGGAHDPNSCFPRLLCPFPPCPVRP